MWNLDGRGGCACDLCASEWTCEMIAMACWQTYSPPSKAWKRQLLRDDPKLHWLDSSVNQLNDGKTGGAWGFTASPVWGGKSTCKFFNGVCRICRIWLWKGYSQWYSWGKNPTMLMPSLYSSLRCETGTDTVSKGSFPCDSVRNDSARSVLCGYSGWLWYGLQLRW